MKKYETQSCTVMPRNQRHGAVADLRVAVCLSGLPKALIHVATQQHLLAVLRPLAVDPLVQLDTFMHMDGVTMDAWAVRRAARALGALNVVFYGNSSKGEEPPDLGACPRRPAGACCKHGYASGVKLRGCLRDIEANEERAGVPYDFVLRMRPDVEHLYRLPPSAQWRCLRRDVAWAMLVLPNASTPCFPGNAYPRSRAGTTQQLVPVTKPGLFLDDNLALLPRRAATPYLSIADQIEKCVPARAQNRLCQSRWEWPECRVHQALASVEPPLLIGELPTTTPAFAFVDCEGANKNGPPCLAPYRRWLYRHPSERTAFPRGRASLLSANLSAAQFAPAALVSESCAEEEQASAWRRQKGVLAN